MASIEEANKLYEAGLAAFRSGNNQECISLTRKSLQIGEQLSDDAVIGQALMGLCRTALRDQDEVLLHSLSARLTDLSIQTEDKWWQVVVAHMNAEMARMKGELDKANRLYDQSMKISAEIGSDNMVATECFNKSFVAIAEGDLTTARALLRRHFAIRSELDEGDISPYGLIALATVLAQEEKIQEAAEVTYVCRRLMKDQDIVPDPADEKPLTEVEAQCRSSLPLRDRNRLITQSANKTCRDLVASGIEL